MKFFPYKIRPIQDKLVEKIDEFLVSNKKSILIEAPTGLGKTVSVISSCLEYMDKSSNEDLVIFFVTSRNTQHIIASQTVKDINEKIADRFTAVNLVGKSHMCLQNFKTKTYSDQTQQSLFTFNKKSTQKKSSQKDELKKNKSKHVEYMCTKLKENNNCLFYNKTYLKNKLSPESSLILSQLKDQVISNSRLKSICSDKKLCPYELSLALTKKSKVIIGDYNYIFNPSILRSILKKSEISLSNAIIIVDEAHNLPDRIINYMSSSLSMRSINILIEILQKNSSFNKLVSKLNNIYLTIKNVQLDNNEKQIRKDFVVFDKELANDLNDALEFFIQTNRDDLYDMADHLIRFLDLWSKSNSSSYIFYIKKDKYSYNQRSEPNVSLYLKCLDPSIITKDLFDITHKLIFMSATMKPMNMYVDILGLENNEIAIFDSPFPKENRLSFILDNSTSKYSERNAQTYKDIADNISDVLKNVNKNAILFFPSYDFMNQVKNLVKEQLPNYQFFEESSELTPRDREELLSDFVSNSPSILFGVTLGSFSESINLIGDYLNIVFIVGLPLSPMTLETKAIINYYDYKFGKGWDYGYYLPAFAKTLQAAGRCIRSDKDKGVIVFYDKRFSAPKFAENIDFYDPHIVGESSTIVRRAKKLF